jgi:hypothetical protein
MVPHKRPKEVTTMHRTAVLSAVIGITAGGALTTASPTGAEPVSSQTSPRQAVEVTTNARTINGRFGVGLGFKNVSLRPATVFVSIKDHLPLTRSEVRLYNPHATFRNGTISIPLPTNHGNVYFDCEILLPKGSTFSVEVDLAGNFGPGASARSQIASLGYGL